MDGDSENFKKYLMYIKIEDWIKVPEPVQYIQIKEDVPNKNILKNIVYKFFRLLSN